MYDFILKYYRKHIREIFLNIYDIILVDDNIIILLNYNIIKLIYKLKLSLLKIK